MATGGSVFESRCGNFASELWQYLFRLPRFASVFRRGRSLLSGLCQGEYRVRVIISVRVMVMVMASG